MPPGEAIFYGGSDLRVLGTETELRRKQVMARLVGTGRDPNGQYGEGVVFDVPRDSIQYAELVDNGWAEYVAPEDDPARGTVDIAQAKVRGDALLHPAEQAIAEHIGDRDHAIVASQDPNAEILSAEEDTVRPRTFIEADEREYTGAEGQQVGHRTSGWEDGPQTGDLATHTTLPATEGQPDGEPRYPADDRVEKQLRTEAAGSTPDAATGTSTDDDDDDPDPDGDGNATAGAQELADAEGIDIATLEGSGADLEGGGKRITKADVQKAVSERDGSGS